MTTPEVLEVATPDGPGRWAIHGGSRPTTLLAMAPGHSGKVDAPDLVALAQRADDDVAVALWTPPFVVAGRGSGSRPAVLDQIWAVAAPALKAHLPDHTRWLQGGHSAGARMACRTALATGAEAVLACSFPLHPPGRPSASRSAELLGTGVPVLVVQGTKDTFGTADELAAVLAQARAAASASERAALTQMRVHPVLGAGHNLVPAKRADPDSTGLSSAIEVAWGWIRDPAAAPT